MEVLKETVVLPGETRRREWTVVRRKKAVVIAPMTEAGRFVLIHQCRIPVRKCLWEFPAGQVDQSFEPDHALLRETAIRELEEETGYKLADAGTLIYLGHYYSSQGFSDETPYLFLAKPVVPTGGGHRPETNESILESKTFSTAELSAMIADSVIQDANTLACFARLTAKSLLL
ncbi:MAG: NUDIX hydrolase [Verrucomicrobia bacterium]|nr:NUDIX hydrolase [Verrucomicrobiota bacterium]